MGGGETLQELSGLAQFFLSGGVDRGTRCAEIERAPEIAGDFHGLLFTHRLRALHRCGGHSGDRDTGGGSGLQFHLARQQTVHQCVALGDECVALLLELGDAGLELAHLLAFLLAAANGHGDRSGHNGGAVHIVEAALQLLLVAQEGFEGGLLAGVVVGTRRGHSGRQTLLDGRQTGVDLGKLPLIERVVRVLRGRLGGRRRVRGC